MYIHIYMYILMLFYMLVYMCSSENYVCGKFHFVDLAGSERAGKTGNRGDRFKGQTLKSVLERYKL